MELCPWSIGVVGVKLSRARLGIRVRVINWVISLFHVEFFLLSSTTSIIHSGDIEAGNFDMVAAHSQTPRYRAII